MNTSRSTIIPTAHDVLTAAGWKPASGEGWVSPLTRRVYPQRAALAIATIKPRGVRVYGGKRRFGKTEASTTR